MKQSLRVKMTLALIFSMILMIFCCWMINRLFLEGYYQKDKVASLSESYKEVNKITGNGEIEDILTISNEIEKTEVSKSVSIYILEDPVAEKPLNYIYPIEMEMSKTNEFGNKIKSFRFDNIRAAVETYIFGRSNQRDRFFEPEVLAKSGTDFTIYKFLEPNLDSFYLDLFGYLDNGYLILIRTGYDSIEDSAVISSRFLAIIGSIVILLGAILMFFYSKSFTKPILELSDISDKMSKLEFDAKYKGNRKDEIGKLGNSINTLSEALEKNISELKAANIALEKDIRNKEQLEEMRKEFLSNVSHELKTPIALIQGYAEGLADNVNDDPESRDYYCEVITDEARKMNSIVKKLLTLNELEFGREKPDIERFDITELVSSVAASFDILAKQKDAKIVCEETEPIYVWADGSQIEEVVTNYISNALNHISGMKVIEIGYRKVSDKLVRVSVFNTGDPIDKKEIGRIWDKFYKIDKARTREYGGSGIGLSIVKAIMEQHNQAYGVENHPAGVEFWFELDTNTVK